MALFGGTLCRAAEDQAFRYPHTLSLALNDVTSLSLTAVAAEVAGLLTVFFGLLSMADRDGVNQEGTLLIVVFLLAYAGLALCIAPYRAAIDALVLAYSTRPAALARENQIIYLRFLRTTDPTLQ